MTVQERAASPAFPPRPPGPRAALMAATMLVPVFFVPMVVASVAFAPAAYAQGGANSNPNGGQSGAGLEAAGRAAAAAADAGAAPVAADGSPSATPAAAAQPGDQAGDQPGAPPTRLTPAGTTAAAPAGAVPQNAITVLLQQATFWHAQSQNGRAMDALTRALELQPNNPEALGLSAQIQVEQGNTEAANAALAKLRQTRPNDPHIAQIDRALRIGQINPAQLAEARRLSQEGRNAEAIQRYQQIFKGNPPSDSLAVEYYQTMSGTEGGWERARDGLAQIIRENPGDLRAQLAYAQLLTYREGARSEGIARLAQLSQNPQVADQATKAWRQSLGWLPVATSSVAPLTDFLQRHPNDAAVQRLVEAARNPPQGPADTVGEGRAAAFRALNANELATAEKGFEATLETNANDADALGGLGLVRLRQGRTGEARSLLQRAIAADPSKRAQWQSALSGSEVPQEYAAIRVAANRGDYAGAERQIRTLMGRGNNPGLQLMLADVQARSGDLSAAEASYRAALTNSPRNSSAMVGLAGVLQQQGRTAEAEDLLTRAGATGSLKQIAAARAQQLREQAAAVTDPATKVGMYRAAMASDPENPWIRLDLARALIRQGQMPEARSLMSQLVSGRQVSTDGLQAAIIFASENNFSDDTAALISRVPPGRRTAQMRATLAQAQLNRDIQATLMYPPDVARQRLLALAAAAPDPDGTRGAALARALYRLNMPAEARAAIVTAQSVTRAGSADQRVNYAGAMLDIGDTNNAQALLNSINTTALTPQQRTAATSMREGLLVRTSDQLNQAGRQADAYDRLAPVLQRDPASPSLNLALARLYSSADNPKEALAINIAVLRRDPANVDARNAAVGAAIASGDRGLADRLVTEGLQLNPNDPRAWITSAELAKARGNNLRAIQDLQRARQLRQQQIGGSDAGADYGTGFGGGDPSSNPGIGAAAAGTVPSGAIAASAFTPGSVAQGSVTPGSVAPGSVAQGSVVPGSLATGSTMTLAPNAPPIYANTPPTTAAARPYPLSPGAAPLPSAYQPTQTQPSAYQPASYQPAAYQPAAYQPTAYQPTAYQPGTYPGARYQPTQYQPAPVQPTPPAAYAQAPIVTQSPFQNSAPPVFAPAPAYAPAPYPTAPAYPAVQPAAPQQQFIYSNPFRSPASTFGTTNLPTAQEDPMTAQINQSIAQLRDQIAPTAQGGVLLRSRSGTAGLDQLTEAAIPMEATFSPGGFGQIRILAQPTYLSAGTVSRSTFGQAALGTQALSIVPAGGTGTPPFTGQEFGSQHAEGVGLDAGYKFGWAAADIGTTPLGFQISNLIGGVEIAPKLSNNVTLRVTGERRAVTDSMLSYGGQKDPRTGAEMGGVTRTRGYAQLELSAGLANFYLGGGYASLKGQNVEENHEKEAGAGGSYPVYRTATDELRLGLDLVYFGFDKNLAGFTLGQGGYFSPQSYFAALIPVNWQSKAIDKLTYSVGGGLGYQLFNSNSSPYYPGNPGLQNQLNAIASGVSGLPTSYPSHSVTGVTGVVHAAAEYALTPSLKVGASGSYQHSGDYDEGQGLLYARYIFNGAE